MSQLSDYLERRVLELFREDEQIMGAVDRELVAIPRRNRRRRSSILCKIGLHDWEAWELKLPGLIFVKRCRRRGCHAARAIKPRALGPTEMLSQFEESERIVARMEAIRGLRPDIARDSDRLLDSWHSREGGSHG